MEFVLQNLILSTEVLREKVDIRYRPNGPVRVSEAGLAFDRGGSATFDTFFNCFRLPEWKHYTLVTNTAIRLKFRGHFKITVLSAPIGGNGAPAIRRSCELKSDDTSWEKISFAPEPEEIVYFELEAIEDSVLLEGCYAGDVENEKMSPAPRLAVVICTHSKEKELLAGLDLLRREIARLPDKSAAIKIIVVDNASSLTQEKVGEDVTLYQNNNTGGSGGFTRGIMEALDDPAGFTHALLMDDDAEIIPDSLCRSLALIRLAKPGFRNARIAGAIVKKEYPGIQHVAIEYYGNGSWRDFQQNRDLSIFDTSDGVPERHIRNNGVCPAPDFYSGWWYCLMPLSQETKNDLPLPFFISFDDMEYGMRFSRRGGKWMRLDGIGALHHAFESAAGGRLRIFLNFRNCIFGSFILGTKIRIGKLVISGLTKSGAIDLDIAASYRKAIDDFLQGPRVLEALPELPAADNYDGWIKKIRTLCGMAWTLLLLETRLLFHRKRYRRIWREAVPGLASMEFWRRYLKLDC